MTPAEMLRSDPSRLGAARAAARLSVSEVARRLKVSRTAVQKWERSTVPADRLDAVSRELGPARPLPAQELVDLVSTQPGVTEARLQAHLAVEVPALVAAGQLHRARVTVRDAAGRHYTKVRLYPGPTPAALERESLDSTDLPALRYLLGYSQHSLATKLGVTRQQVANLEATRIPDGRQDQLRQVLVAPLRDLDLAAARARAGLGQAELARRLGRVHSTVHMWEKGTRTPTLEQFAQIGHALAATADDEDQVDVAAQRIVDVAAAAGPDGVTGAVLVRLLGRGRRGGPGDAQYDQRGLTRALRRHQLHWRLTWVRDVGGSWRQSRRLHAGPRPRAGDEQGMTGLELAKTRREAGVSQHELAAELGTVWGTVSKWERRGRRTVPPVIAAAVPGALARLTAGRPGLLEQVRTRLLAAAQRSPGCTVAQLLVDAGYGRANPLALSVLEELAAAGRVHLRLTADRGASYSTHQGVHPGPAPAGQAAARPGTWLRERRNAAGLHQRELAAAVGVTQTAVAHWERTGVPALRVDDVVTVLAATHRAAALPPAELRAARVAAHLTQAEVGAALGVTQAAVARWERIGVPRGRAQVVRDLLAA
jgi:transcriptional regulator with XRE-family HTH domain